MIDFIFNMLSAFFQMNMRDPHEVPFAMPLMMGAILGLTIGFSILSFIGNEQKIQRLVRNDESGDNLNATNNEEEHPL